MYTLEHNETTLKIFRKHWFVMFLELLLFIIIAIVPVVAVWLTFTNTGGELIPPMGHVLTVLFTTWILVLWIGFFIIYSTYFLDVWILTNQRLIDVDQKNLFVREVATVRIEKIEDVTVNISGLFPSLLGYGDVHVQSAGAEKEFTIRNVRNPNQVKELIMNEQHHEYERARPVRITK